ncbi:MAG: PaaI family thioesterase [Actinomycetota bacterium]|nr:PaaI family thioesterase [Actinomycetota bacterium]
MEAGKPGPDGPSELIGLVYDEFAEELVRAHVPVGPAVVQQFGIVHGGIHSLIAESICSAATGMAVLPLGFMAMGQSNYATFLRPISAGTINATATCRHRGRTTWIWDCELTDDDGRLCAMVRMTVAVRPLPDVPAERSSG